MKSQYRVTIEKNETGQKLSEVWTLADGALSDGPEGQPAVQKWDETTGNLVSKQRYEDGKQHCLTEAACQVFDATNGRMIEAHWFKHGVGHRDQVEGERRPSTWYCDAVTGFVYFEVYEIEGNRHRFDGASSIERCPDSGKLVSADVFYNGRRMESSIFDLNEVPAYDPDALKPLVP